MDDLISIGEFSVRSGLSPKRLRSYATDGLLVPAAVDASSGYRFYAPGQIHRAVLIDALRRAGMPLAEIRAVLRNPFGDLLDGWAKHLESDAVIRREALDSARRLLDLALPGAPATTDLERSHRESDGSELTGHQPVGREAGDRSHLDPERAEQKETRMRLTMAARTETGLVRERNEDAVLTEERLAAVADGLGGAPGGEVASELAVALLQAAFTGGSAEVLAAAARAANRAIWERAEASEELGGMGTTICAAGLDDEGNLVIVNVGDSRTYLAHDGALVQLTEDHSVAADLVRRGELGEQEALEHPQRAILTRALGVGPDVDVDRVIRPAVPGDRLLLCTDGLFTEVAASDIASVMTRAEEPQAAVDRLVELALAAGGRDNVSVVVARIEA